MKAKWTINYVKFTGVEITLHGGVKLAATEDVGEILLKLENDGYDITTVYRHYD